MSKVKILREINHDGFFQCETYGKLLAHFWQKKAPLLRKAYISGQVQLIAHKI